MIYLHQYPPIWDLPSLSPFCIKVETYLRMLNLPYEIVIVNNPLKGPKGKMPVLVDGQNTIPDSSFIVDYLQRQYAPNLDFHLSDQQQALAHTIRKMVEENLYFVVLYSRWIDPCGKHIVDRSFRKFFPKCLSGMALKWIRYRLKKQAYYQGMGRHTLLEVYAIGCQDIKALSHLLGDNQSFFLGDEPHAVDASIYAFLITILQSPFTNPLKDYLLKQNNLLSYSERMKKLFY